MSRLCQKQVMSVLKQDLSFSRSRFPNSQPLHLKRARDRSLQGKGDKGEGAPPAPR